MSKRKLSLEVVKRLQCQKNVKIEGKKRTLKTVQKREKTIYKRRKFTQIYANFRKFPQKYAETFTISGNCKLIFKSISNNLNAFSRVTKCHLKMTFFSLLRYFFFAALSALSVFRMAFYTVSIMAHH